MTRITAPARLLLGLAFVVFGLNYFVPFLPMDPPTPDALVFLGAFAGAGFLALIKAVEIVAGLLLLSNRFVPLALALLAPILVGITVFNARLGPGVGLPLVLVALELALAWSYRAAFAPMLRAQVTPDPVVARRSAPVPAVRLG
jgi:hypothetical protein